MRLIVRPKLKEGMGAIYARIGRFPGASFTDFPRIPPPDGIHFIPLIRARLPLPPGLGYPQTHWGPNRIVEERP